MLTDRISIAILEDFVKKVRTAARSNQKVIQIPIHEAETLVYNLNLVTLQLLDKFQTAEVKKSAQEDVLVVAMDGGGFDEKR
jgi:hypothetical protein